MPAFLPRVMILSLLLLSAACDSAPSRPNIIFILADDLGYGELGSYGQKLIQTPHLDRMAAEGLRFTQFYAGSTVCAPSRSVLMTGQHAGRTWVRGNRGSGSGEDVQTLRPQDLTVAEKLKQAGYATALCGKWGLGELGSTGHPNHQGFDHFYGYLNQRHAHNYYPTFLIRNQERVALRNVADQEDAAGGGWAKEKVDYSHDLIMDEALGWVRMQHAKPFFLYLALTIPHANNEAARGVGDGQEVPDYGPYKDRNWPNPDKGQAAMITRMDRDIGRLFDLLREMGIDNRTLVIFSSDNGPHKEGRNNPELFDANGPLRGMKRDLYEGGIRVPTLARWPGTVPPGRVSDHLGSFADFMATVCELAGVDSPETDGISFVPTLQGRPDAQKQHPYLYWEFYEQGSKQAVRFGRYKAIRMPMFTGKTEIYDLQSDLGETTDLAASRPDLVARAEAYMKEAHVPNSNWQVQPPARRTPATP